MAIFSDAYEPYGVLTTLVAGVSPTVADTKITANSVIECGVYTPGGTQGALYLATKTASTGYVIKSTSASDTSVVWCRVKSY